MKDLIIVLKQRKEPYPNLGTDSAGTQIQCVDDIYIDNISQKLLQKSPTISNNPFCDHEFHWNLGNYQ